MMSPEVLEYLQSAEVFQCTEDKLVTLPWSFARCVDVRSIPEHRYYEGTTRALFSRKLTTARLHDCAGRAYQHP
jgi:hypothetical protein